jgi:hypothetical protein
MPLYRLQDRAAIGGFLEAFTGGASLVGIDEARFECNFLKAGDLDALAVLERADELAGFKQALCVPVSSQA